jgi:hypothetical protein
MVDHLFPQHFNFAHISHLRRMRDVALTFYQNCKGTLEFEKRFNRQDVPSEHFAAMIDSQDPRHSCLFAPIRLPHDGKISNVSSHFKAQSDYMFVELNFETPSVKLDTEDARK